jgi:hypothetical protein
MGNLKDTDQLGDLGLERKIFKWIGKKRFVSVWTSKFSKLSDGICKRQKNIAISISNFSQGLRGTRK